MDAPLRDITERKRAEAQLLYHAAVLAHLSDAVVATDTNWVLTAWNRAAEEMFGWKAEEVLGRPSAEVLPATEIGGRPLPRQAARRALAKTGRYRAELTYHRRDGSPVDVEANAIAIRDHEGRVVGYATVMRDITERKRTEEALRETRDYLEKLIDYANAPIIVWDPSFTITRFNHAFERLTGRPASEVVGQRLEVLFPEGERAASMEQIARTVRGEFWELIEIPILHESGEVRRVLWNSANITGPDGRTVVATIAQGTDITERTRAEEEIKSLARFPSENPSPVLRVTQDGRLLYANEASDPLLRESGSAIGGPAPASLQALAQEALNKQSTTTADIDEAGRVWSLSVAPVTDSGYADLYARDVTERKRAEDMLRKSEEELRKLNRTLMALSDSNQAMMRAHSEAEYLNEVCKIIVEDCGHSMVWIGFAEEDEAKTVRPVAQAGFEEGYLETVNITWADTERGRGPTGTAIRTGKPAICRNMLTDPNFAPWRKEATKRGYASSIVLPLTTAGKAFGAINIYSRDPDPFSEKEVQLLSELADDLAYGITAIRLREEHAKAEEAIEQERQRLQVLVDTSPVGIVLADADGRLLLVNREAERIFGYSHVEPDLGWYGRAVRRRPDSSIYTREELPLERALRRGETVRAEEVWFQFPDGRTLPALTNATPLYGASGEITGAIAIIQDMTPLEELERVRGEFLGMVTHELKTPLTAIKGSAATALGSARPLNAADVRELFQIIDQQADRLRELVDDLLDMTRIEAGSLSINPEPMDLRAAIEDARLAFMASAGSHEVRVELPDDLLPVKADRGRIDQVMVNLLTNAAKFSPPTAPITIWVEQDPVNVTVHVQDEGRGIAQEKLPQLFKKFSRLHEESGHGLSSTGLGLAICKGIIEAHGGRIWADSAGEGKGTTFSFNLPIAVPDTSAALAGTERGPAQMRKVTRPSERTRVLAVDDEPHIQRYLQRALSEAGYQATVTGDPSETVKLVELEEPDLVVLDLRLPGTSGFEVLQRIRELSQVPVIFLTASDSEEDAVQALKAGADDYITKPFSPSELLARIEAVLRRRATAGPSETRRSLVLEDLTVNFAEREVTLAGEPVSLSATEYKLLYELATHAGRVLTYDQILQRVWGPEYSGETELVRSFVRNLRRKLREDARNPRFILTERQVGYRMPKPQS